MADKSKGSAATSWLPGASDKIGFGINIFGDFVNPTLKHKFLDLTPGGLDKSEWHDQEIADGTRMYKLPNSIQYSGSPISTSRYIVAASKIKLTEELSTSAGATATYGAFTGTLKASYKRFNETTEDRWYCLTDASQTVYSLIANNIDTASLHPKVKTSDIYTDLLTVLERHEKCNEANQEVYFSFFNWFGTHVISGVTLGGGLHLYTSLKKEYIKDEQKVKTSLEAEFGGFFNGNAKAGWKKTNEAWLEHREGSLTVYGGNVGLLSGISAGVLPDTDLTKDYKKWGLSVKTTPMMTSFQLSKIGDVFGTRQHRKLVNEAYERYAESYLQLTFANKENKLEWRKKPVDVPAAAIQAIHGRPTQSKSLDIPRFQGWCVIDRASAKVVKVIPFATNAAEQVPAELKGGGQYNNDQFILLFSHWDMVLGGDQHTLSMWKERPFNDDVASCLRRCGGGDLLEAYNAGNRARSGFDTDPYAGNFYVLCGVIGSGKGKGKEFTNAYTGMVFSDTRIKDIIIPLVPSSTGAEFLLNFLD